MESYQAFLDRISAFEKPELELGNGYFAVNPSLAHKVGEDNAFRPFYGDTVVFDLKAEDKERMQSFVAALHREAPECFCEPFSGSTFHMTLHDLNNSPVMAEVAERMPASEKALQSVLAANPVGKQTIRMRSKAIFNMVSTSLVVGLYPADAQEYEKLMALYQLVDSVLALPYPLTPHITLGYFCHAGFERSSAEKLERLVNRLNLMPFDIELDTEHLVYQHFESMNCYHSLWNFTCP